MAGRDGFRALPEATGEGGGGGGGGDDGNEFLAPLGAPLPRRGPAPHDAMYNFRFNAGDVNAFFSVLLDNIANVSAAAGIMVYAYQMPSRMVYEYMVPGMCLGVMLGSIALGVMAEMYDRWTGRIHRWTAIPLGLDAPSTIGLPLVVVGPEFVRFKATMSIDDAALKAWHLGCATVFLIGIIKAFLAFATGLSDHLHPSGKQGALAGIGFALLGLLELTTIVPEPVTGLLSLWLLLVCLVPRASGKPIAMPFKLLPGILVSACTGTIVYYIMAGAGISVAPLPENIMADSQQTMGHFANFFGEDLGDAFARHISIAIPYAILVHVSGLSVVDGAAADDNKYNKRAVLLLDAACTVISAMFGSVSQTTPYIGHHVYKKDFDAGALYTIATGVTVGLGGWLGYITILAQVLPKPAIMPIFVIVALGIIKDTIHTDQYVEEPLEHGGSRQVVIVSKDPIRPWHAPAVLMAMWPSAARVVSIVLSQLYDGALQSAAIDPEGVKHRLNLNAGIVETCGMMFVLANGFILTALLWGSAMAHIIDGKLIHAGVTLTICGILSLFGIIHSVDHDAGVYLPWNIQDKTHLPYHWCAGYVLSGVVLIIGYLLNKRFNWSPDDTPEAVGGEEQVAPGSIAHALGHGAGIKPPTASSVFAGSAHFGAGSSHFGAGSSHFA